VKAMGVAATAMVAMAMMMAITMATTEMTIFNNEE